MSELYGTEQLIINELFDHSIFTSTVTEQTTRAKREAINALKRPATQQRLNAFLKDLVGMGPSNFQENLVFLPGKKWLSPETVHVLLATLKAVINLPELQNTQLDRVVAVKTVVRQVHSEVVDLDEKEIRRQIIDLFVQRLGLFVEDEPVMGPDNQAQEVEEYWDVSPDFNLIAQCLVTQLQGAQHLPDLTAIQRVNRALLNQRYLSASSRLWPDLLANKQKIADQWRQTNRFVLECGDDYALLLDSQRVPSTAKPFVIAVGVARSLGVGIPSDQLTKRIHQISEQVLPGYVINVSLVKEALHDNALARLQDGYVIATPLVHRFVMRTTDEGEI
ncbi:hypothetical protein [Levilactobacillus tujiorum]|uniref:Uncharacterized protein n=1 Tax=Levilactobacillus tujiorum TaxID=2912243 RepID=A0ABX1L6B8_9LACO|nr:hypothetical protein [Levilactobacillus tujiorum]MCH5464805.1 hypothetical protein [Levilactobacillus tujiorum]NLR11897.1 hypothetical protein [Lactobacillus sp. HBUAS51387]NLR29841.1 hypothetical protein [Levilactobacillus tujiorum]